MKIKTLTICFAALLLAVFSLQSTVLAANKEKGVARLMKRVARLQARLDRRVARLSPMGIKRLSQVNIPNAQDSDLDGVIDLLETAMKTLICLSDTDGDGLEDGDEIEEEDSDPLDGSDGREVTGFITALSATTVEVDGIIAIIDEDTEFEGENDQVLTLADFAVGSCVELEAFLNDSDEFVAHELSLEEEAGATCSDDDEEEDDDEDGEDDDDEDTEDGEEEENEGEEEEEDDDDE